MREKLTIEHLINEGIVSKETIEYWLNFCEIRRILGKMHDGDRILDLIYIYKNEIYIDIGRKICEFIENG